jgi:hypothetical protein
MLPPIVTGKILMYIYEIKYAGINSPCERSEGILNWWNARSYNILLTLDITIFDILEMPQNSQ